MTAGLTVDLPVLRRAAGALTDGAHLLSHGLAGAPGLVVPEPPGPADPAPPTRPPGPVTHWRTGAALARLEAAVHSWLGGVGARVAGTAGAVRIAADGYQAADDRAAGRLAALPR